MIKHTFTISKWIVLSSFRSGIGVFFDIAFPILWLLFAGYVITGYNKDVIKYTIIQTLVLMTLTSAIFGLGILFVDLKKSGVLRHLYTTAVSKHSIIIGTIIGRLVINILQFLSILVASEYFYKSNLGIHWMSLGLFTIICGVGYSGIALLLSHIAKTSESYHAIANIVFFPFMFLTGLTVPFFILPPFLQNIGRLLPPYHMFELGKSIINSNLTLIGTIINLSTIFFIGFLGYIKVSVDYRWDPNHKPKYPVLYDLIIIALASLVPFINNIVVYTGHKWAHFLKPSYILKVKNYFDGEKFIDDSAAYIGVQDDRIVFTAKEIPQNWENKKVYDYSTYVALPGLTDAHIHLDSPVVKSYDPKVFTDDRMKHDLYAGYLGSGITTIRSVGDDYSNLKSFKELNEQKIFTLPIILMSGPIFTAPNGHPTQLTRYMPKESAERFVIEIATPQQAKEKLTFIINKVKPDWIEAVYDKGNEWTGEIPRMKKEVLKTLIEESHKNKLRVSVHIGSQEELKTATELGADMIEHLPCEIIDDDTVKLLKEKNVPICPTIFAQFSHIEPLKEFINTNFIRERLFSPVKTYFDKYQIAGFLDWIPQHYKAIAEMTISSHINKCQEAMKINLRKLTDNGITLLSCSGAGNPYTFHGPGLLSELQTLVKFGLTPQEVLQTSTGNVEKILHIKAGKIRKEYFANIALYEKNPLENISNIYSLKTIVILGRIIKISDIISNNN